MLSVRFVRWVNAVPWLVSYLGHREVRDQAINRPASADLAGVRKSSVPVDDKPVAKGESLQVAGDNVLQHRHIRLGWRVKVNG